jgi:hypothetical protein
VFSFASTKEHFSMTLPLASQIHETLSKHLPSLDTATRGDVVRTLIEHNYAQNNMGRLWAAASPRTKLSPVQAASDPRNHTLLRELKARCARLGYDLNLSSNAPISLFDLDQKFDGADVQERLRIKTGLKSLGLL